MAYRITSLIVDQGDHRVHVEHRFYGETLAEAREMKEHHLGTCTYFKSAEASGDVAEQVEEISDEDWPEVESSDEE